MALNAYLKMKGQKAGQIKGSTTQKGREGLIMVFAYTHGIDSPRDTASGRPTGKRKHGALTITKEIDKASPLIYSALVNNETITEFDLRFWRPSSKGTGAEEQFYTIKLTNASISAVDQYVLDTKDPANMKYPPMEKVSFTYQKITWTYEDGGITAEDDWEAPVT